MIIFNQGMLLLSSILLLLLYSKPLFLDTYSLELVWPPEVQINHQGPIQIPDT